MKNSNISLTKITIVLAFLLITGVDSFGQFFRNRIVSPEILPGNMITFRLNAPQADTVVLRGEWLAGFTSVETLEKNDTGLWQVTVGPVAPEIYGYYFIVDGLQVLDPSNPLVRRDGARNASLVLVPGKESELYGSEQVPHGNLAKVWYESPTLGLTRRMYVYTPPGYDAGDREYPVLYLLHGGGGDEDAWTTMGRAPYILDNLIARGNTSPMLVVMPNGNAYQAAAPGDEPSGTGERPADFNSYRGMFEESLVNDIIPYIESNYRVLKGKDNRAIAGLSMGGGHTVTVTTGHPGLFSYIGVYSAGVRNPDESFPEQLKAIKDNGVKLYWVGCGVEDRLAYQGSQTLVEELEKQDMPYIFRESDGGHTWANWRLYLSEMAPLLFK